MPTTKKQPPKPKQRINWPRFILICFLLFGALNMWIYFYGIGFGELGTTMSHPTPTPTARATPILLPPTNGVKGVYFVNEGKHDGPSESKIVFDPLDVQKEQQLTVTVTLTDTAPIQSVTGILQTDHGSQTMIFSRTSGTDLSGQWQATTALQDSVLYTYIMKVTATSANGTNTVTSPLLTP